MPRSRINRRRVLAGTGATLVACGLGRFAGAATTSAPDSILRAPLSQALPALSSGRVSAVDYCRAALAEAQRFADHHIFTQLSPVYVETTAAAIDARRRAGEKVGALAGVPYALKDSVDMVEYYTISGHPALATFAPLIDAPLVARCKEADAVCIGKTQIPALSMWWTTENPMTGDTGNPFNVAYKTGGSSGGSGAAVAARIVPFAIAEDTGGSVRVPAAVNGVQGFRPTTGRWPTEGTMPIGFSDTLGPIARSVADLELLDSLLATEQPPQRPSSVEPRALRIGYQRREFFDGLHAWVEDNVEETLRALSRAGVTLVEVEGLPAAEVYQLAVSLQAGDLPGAIARYFKRHRVYDRSAFGLVNELHMDGIKKIWMPGLDNAPAGEAYFELVERLLAARRVYEQTIQDQQLDALMYPTTKVPNTRNDGPNVIVGRGPEGEPVPELMIGANMMFSPGMRSPSVSLFSGMDRDGLPLGMTFDARSGGDARLLKVAQAIEGVLPELVEPERVVKSFR